MTALTFTEIAASYLHALPRADGDAIAELFAVDGVLDDFGGGHHVGRERIREFVNEMPGDLIIDGPVKMLEDRYRINAYGILRRSPAAARGPLEPQMIRWVFHIADGKIQHLSNSWLRSSSSGRPAEWLMRIVAAALGDNPGP